MSFSACKSEPYSSSGGARISDYAAAPSQPTPSTSMANVPLITEAHSNPASYSPGAQTGTQPKYQPAFISGAENDGYGYPSQNLPPPTALISNHPPTNSTARRRAEKAPAHVKKPLNAFMLFMKEMRAKVVAECTMKESAAINQILGRKWHALPHEEQAKFYEMAKKEKELHQRKYPGWSARDNYAYHAKRRKNRCRYRVFSSNQSYGEQPPQQQPQHGGQLLESSSPSSGQESLPRDKSKVNSETPFEFSGALKNPSFYGSPFGLTGMTYENRGVGESSYNIMGELLPGFGFLDRNVPPNYSDGFPNHSLHQQPHPSSSQSLNHSDSNCNSKDDCVPRLMAGIPEYGDAFSSGQHSLPNLPPTTQNQANWLINSTHYPHLAYNVLSSASTSPWSQTQQKFEDRFQRQLTQSSSSTFSNPYSTPPYNPNGSFDYRYTDLNPPTYSTIPQSSPLPLDNESSLRPTYEGAVAKSSTFQTDGINSSCGDPGSSAAPLYGFPTI